jgi:putative ABC transport system permease protein
VNLIESIRLALGSLRANKLRSVLTMLGIIIGVGSVIALLAFGNGYGAFLDAELNKLGAGSFYVFPGSDSRRADNQQPPQLTSADAEAIRSSGRAPNVVAVAAIVSDQVNVTAGGERATYNLMGTEPPYFTITTNTLGAGSYYTGADETARARVAVIGLKVAERLYGSPALAVGQRLTINGVGFEVVGVLSTKPGFAGDPQRQVFVPYRTARDWLMRNQFDRRVDVSEIIVQARSREVVQPAIREVTELLRERHRLTYQPNDFGIFNLEDIAQQIGAIVAGFNAFLGTVAGISLLVGGIGIMNIMLVSVTERTREIGLRKAVGARQRDILQQFLVEALVLSLVGGALGVLLGYALSPIGTLLLQGMGGGGEGFETSDARAVVTSGSVLLAAGVAGTIGLVFGFFPALQAARMRPIDALRTE